MRRRGEESFCVYCQDVIKQDGKQCDDFALFNSLVHISKLRNNLTNLQAQYQQQRPSELLQMDRDK